MSLLIGLIELLFDNVFLLFIIFGVISVLMNRARGAGGQRTPQRTPQRPRQGMPPFSGNPPAGPQPAPMPRQQPRMMQEAAFERQRMEEEPPRPLEGRETPAVPVKQAPAAKPAPQRSSKTSQAPLLHPRHAAQGLMWSEVLGPPRAHKPHRTMRR